MHFMHALHTAGYPPFPVGLLCVCPPCCERPVSVSPPFCRRPVSVSRLFGLWYGTVPGTTNPLAALLAAQHPV